MQISQLPMVQIGKFLCLSDREFPEFFKTHPTLICRSIFNASRSLQTNRTCYLIALVCWAHFAQNSQIYWIAIIIFACLLSMLSRRQLWCIALTLKYSNDLHSTSQAIYVSCSHQTFYWPQWWEVCLKLWVNSSANLTRLFRLSYVP